MAFDRRSFLASAMAFAAPARPPRAARPNVLVVLSDQESQRVPRGLLRLPNRERIERNGVTFENCWCATPQCSPARGALWTGRWPHATGVVANIGAAGAVPLSPHVPSLGQAFRAAGYRTGYFGKWHLSEGRAAAGEAFGWETFRERGEEAGDPGVARAAAEWIAARAEERTPWLAAVSLLQPHDIYEYPNIRAKLAAEGKTYPIRRGPPRRPAVPATWRRALARSGPIGSRTKVSRSSATTPTSGAGTARSTTT